MHGAGGVHQRSAGSEFHAGRGSHARTTLTCPSFLDLAFRVASVAVPFVSVVAIEFEAFAVTADLRAEARFGAIEVNLLELEAAHAFVADLVGGTAFAVGGAGLANLVVEEETAGTWRVPGAESVLQVEADVGASQTLVSSRPFAFSTAGMASFTLIQISKESVVAFACPSIVRRVDVALSAPSVNVEEP